MMDIQDIYKRMQTFEEEVREKLYAQLADQRMNQIIQAFELYGYKFTDRKTFIDFVSKNCHRRSYGNPYVETLFLKDKAICYWDNTPHFKMEQTSATLSWGEFHIIL